MIGGTMLRDEAIETLLMYLERQPYAALEITVDNGVFRAEVAAGDTAEWAEHTILTDALVTLVGLLDA